ncbi:hypothetical protein B0H14DRAFT_3028612, partial [Mycena olivaceomarginata]
VWISIIAFPSLVGRAQFSAPSSSSLSSFHCLSLTEIHHLTFWPILREPGGSTQNPLILQKNWCFVGSAALEGCLQEVLVNYIQFTWIPLRNAGQVRGYSTSSRHSTCPIYVAK